MRLVKAVEKLEHGHDDTPKPKKYSFEWVGVDGEISRGRAVGAVWSEQEHRLGRRLAKGERLAVDLYLWRPPGVGSEDYVIEKAVERATRDLEDRGLVYCRGGVQLGRVLRTRGRLIMVGWLTGAASAR